MPRTLCLKSSENSFETPKRCLSRSIRIGNHFFSNWKQNTFFKNFRLCSFGKCRIVPKNLKGGLWDLSTYILLQNIKKLEGETFEKKSHSTEKIHKGGPWVSFAFVCYVKKGKHERGRPFALSLRGCNWPI